MPTSLFGTDGVRGRAGSSPLDERTLVRLGAAVARTCGRQAAQPRVLIGRDTRESGVWVTRHLARGVEAEAAQVADGGVLSTPAVAFLARDGGFDAGLVVSASHNPFQDNGVKVFTGEGMKADDDLEACLTAIVADYSYTWADVPLATTKRVSLDDSYVEHTRRILDGVVVPADLRIAIDCANGAAYKVAPAALWELGAEVVTIGNEPNGTNINLNCGSTHPVALAKKVHEVRADIGIALDGDADRVLIVDENGAIVDGDQLMALIAESWASDGILRGNGLVATVMSNLGLERFMQDKGMELIRTKVGDRYVVEHMRQNDYNLGGEQSGHIVMSDFATTGDGLVAALQVMACVKRMDRPVSEVCKRFEPVPQLLKNVRFSGGEPLKNTQVKEAIREAEEELAGKGRLVIRPSGTEPLIRVMAEGDDLGQIETIVDGLVGVISGARSAA